MSRISSNSRAQPRIVALLGLLVGVTASNCDAPGDACTAGTEGCECREDQCVGDLSCRSGFCVDPDAEGEDDGPDEGDDEGDDEGGRDCSGNGTLQVDGALRTNVANVEFNRVAGTVFHKRDVDEFEDGCVSFVRFVFKYGEGCTLDVTAEGRLTPQARLAVTEVEFSADSQCPNFPDANEGVYRMAADGLVVDATGIVGDLMVPDRNVNQSCFDATYEVYLAGSLFDGSNNEIILNPTVLTVSGTVVSRANERACPTF